MNASPHQPGAPCEPRVVVTDRSAARRALVRRLLAPHGCDVECVAEPAHALERTGSADVLLIDPQELGGDAWSLCRAVRARPPTAALPVVVLAKTEDARVRDAALDAGADDFIAKPVREAELVARVRAWTRSKRLHDVVERQARDLQAWNRVLEGRVAAHAAHVERLQRLKRFFSPRLAELIESGSAEDPLRTHRRDITVVFLDLRGFTAFAETSEPEDVMAALGEFHRAMGRRVLEFEGTLERFTGDGLMVFFNDPVPIHEPARRAVRMALAMRADAATLASAWRRRGYDLGLGIGIAQGFATVGAIGFEGRIDYGAIGTVTNLASRLCHLAEPGEILVSQRVHADVDDDVRVEDLGAIALQGFRAPVHAYRLIGPREGA